MRIAFSTLACPGWTVEELADAAGRYGYDGLEWRLADGALLGPRTSEDVWRRIAHTCAEHGLGVACLDTSCVFVQADDEGRRCAVTDAVELSHRAAAIGAGAIRVFGGPVPDGVPRTVAIAAAREALAEAASRCVVDLLVETHDAWSKAADAAELVSGIPGTGVLWDVAHTHRAGEPVTTSAELAGEARVVHVKDALGDRLCALGDGDVPLRAVVAALAATAPDAWLSFEWEKLWHPELAEPGDALPAAAASLRALTGS